MTTTLSAPTGPTGPTETVPPSRPRSPLARHAALGALLAATAVLYLWNLAVSGWANSFYAAAAQAGGQSWEAWFFGSSDAANSITVDKPPAALWVSGLSVRIFGLSSWSILVPQALMGVAAVWLLYAAVRRTAGTAAGLLAGAVLAVTPVAVLMFRYNNPDALMVLLLVAAAYAVVRAVEAGRTRWLLLAAAFVGFAFLTKMLQAFLVLPALTAVWLLAAPVGIGRRLRDLALATVTLLVSAGWWVLVVELWPADARPYIGGSQTNSVLDLMFGYNGFGRITGDEVGSVGGGRPGPTTGGGWGATGLTRLFNSEFAGQGAWLLPAAFVLLVALLWWTRRAPRTDRLRAGTVLWGGWLLVTWLVFSLMQGIFHPYYLVALAPGIAALVGIGGAVLWRGRGEFWPRATLAAVLAITVVWAFVLLRRTPDWQPWLAWTVLGAGFVAVLALLGAHLLPRLVVAGAAAVAVAVALAGPTGYALVTAGTAHTGAIPTAGPSTMGRGIFFARPGGATSGQAGGGSVTGPRAGTGAPTGTGRPGGTGLGGTGLGGTGLGGTGLGGTGAGATGRGTAGPGAMGQGGGRGGFGGLLGATAPPAAAVELVGQNPSAYTWVAAAVGSNNAAAYQLATGDPVMAIGGYNGTDPSPTLEEFQQLVAQGRIHWFVGSAGIGGTASGGSDQSRLIAAWVEATFTPTTVDGVQLYDLTGAS